MRTRKWPSVQVVQSTAPRRRRSVNIAQQKKLRTRKWKNVKGIWVSASDVEQPKVKRVNRKDNIDFLQLKKMRTHKWPPVEVKSIIPWNETRKGLN